MKDTYSDQAVILFPGDVHVAVVANLQRDEEAGDWWGNLAPQDTGQAHFFVTSSDLLTIRLADDSEGTFMVTERQLDSSGGLLILIHGNGEPPF
ncbi:MAG: hypothetical protein IH941_07125 [Acidobacteria bacterium]|nr:hypothetical protein [Acidobacteriota bacterium]